MEQSVKPDRKYYTKNALILLTISVCIILVVAIIINIIEMTDGEPEAAFIIGTIGTISIILLWIVVFPIVLLWIKNLMYVIHGDHITVQKGILTKTQKNIPFRAITDFALQRTIYDRLLGIGSIKIQTAGQTTNPSGYEGSLSGLLDYESLHNELRHKIKQLHPVSEALTTSEPLPKSDTAILAQILEELKQIRKNTQK